MEYVKPKALTYRAKQNNLAFQGLRKTRAHSIELKP